MERTTAVVFDVDGVILDTAEVHERIWTAWARHHALDVRVVLSLLPGRRTEDVIAQVAPRLAHAEERRKLDRLMRDEIRQVRPFPAAGRLLRDLSGRPWGLVTSGSHWSVRLCFRQCDLPLPAVQVYGEDVRDGKPAPDGYLEAARRFGLEPGRCVVVEDAPAGVAAAKRAGCAVLALATTHAPETLREADLCVPTLVDAAELLLRPGWLPGEP